MPSIPHRPDMNIGLEYIEYALTFNLFELHRPLQLGYLVNASANEDNFQLRFTPPGLPDTIVIEGTLDKLRVYLRDPDDPQLFIQGSPTWLKTTCFSLRILILTSGLLNSLLNSAVLRIGDTKACRPAGFPLNGFGDINISWVVLRLFWKPPTSLDIVYYVTRNTVASWTHQR